MLQEMSTEELTWLQASALIDPPIDGDDIPSLNNTCDSASSTSLSNSNSFDSTLPLATQLPSGLGASNSPSQRSLKPPRPEWIYRRPKPPAYARSHCPTPPYSSHLNGRSMPSRSNFIARAGTSFSRSPGDNGDNAISYPVDHFSSAIFHSRSHSVQSFSPSLKSIGSKSSIALERTPSHSKISSPKLMSVRPPSISSSSSISTSTSSPPRTPVSNSPSPYTKTRRPLPYRPHPETDPTLSRLSSSCPPSKSILTRSSSMSTKESCCTGSKSVKFAAVPVVHYATASYWDLENFDKEEITMGINVDAMDVDDSYHGYRTHVALPKDSSRVLDIAKLRESQCTTPTPEREKAITKGLKRFMSLNRKPLAATTTTTSVATVYRSPLPTRPIISMPYALGTHPTSALQPNASLPYSSPVAADSAPDLVGVLPLRSAPSLESIRTSKSSATRSVRSMGSFKSSSSIRGIKAWLSRWTWGGPPQEY